MTKEQLKIMELYAEALKAEGILSGSSKYINPIRKLKDKPETVSINNIQDKKIQVFENETQKEIKEPVMDETEYLMSSSANAKRLLTAIENSKKDEERVSLDEVIKRLKEIGKL